MGSNKSKGVKMAEEATFCSNCGEEIDAKAEICPKCGVRVKAPPAGEKNPGLAAVLSFLIIGLGQIYNGQIGKGIGLIVGMVISAFLFVLLIGIPIYIILWLYSIYDAYNTAKKINAGEITV